MRYAVLMALILSACVPIALPPTHARLSGGVSNDARALAEWRAGIYPAQLVPPVFERNWLAGLGYVGRTGGVLSIGHGVYAEVGLVHTRRYAADAIQRLSVSVAPELIRRGDFDHWGRAGTLTFAWERVGAVHGAAGGSSGRLLAVASHGEAAIGAQISLTAEQYGERSLYAGMIGVRATIPALAGILFAPELLTGLAR